MRFPSTMSQTADGQWSLRHDGPEVGLVRVTAATREQALEKLRGEIRYRLELCPCSGKSYQHIKIEICENDVASR